MEQATFGAGCFWCTEAIFKELKGVERVVSGYAEGAEVAEITFDPKVISYKQLLNVFWHVYDPTTLNRQGNDIGTQYRSAIFYHNDEQKKAAEKSKREIEKEGIYKDPIVTEIIAFEKFYPAETYHQEYYRKNTDAPYCQFVIDPKLQKFREKFKPYLKTPI